MMSVQIQYRFNYYHERDIVEFCISVDGQGFVSIVQPFFEQIKGQRGAGVKEDIKVEFDQAQWERMMETKDEQKQN